MPRPTTSVRRSPGSRASAGRAAAGAAAGAAGGRSGVAAGVAFGLGEMDGNGDFDMDGASLGGAGRNGGTPRPLSAGSFTAVSPRADVAGSASSMPAGR